MTRVVAMIALLCGIALAQQPPASKRQNTTPPEDNQQTQESSSRDTKIDLSPPKDDAKNHPLGGAAVSDAEAPDEVQEFHPWDPHRAAKNIEVGDFYFKRKNYRAALDRYREALLYKPNDALANFHMAQCFEKLDDPQSAVTHYQQYLKILPHGPLAEDAQRAVQRLKPVALSDQR